MAKSGTLTYCYCMMTLKAFASVVTDCDRLRSLAFITSITANCYTITTLANCTSTGTDIDITIGICTSTGIGQTAPGSDPIAVFDTVGITFKTGLA